LIRSGFASIEICAHAHSSGLLRFVLALSPSANPEFATIMKVVSALGLRLHVSTAAAKSTA